MSTFAHTQSGSATTRGSRRRWWGLLVIALGQLMMTLDVTIVNVALPTIQTALDISTADRQWAITAYSLAFAGLLLLGGRVGDYTGRKRALLIALVGFAVASAVGGAAINLGMLIAARAAQGAFAALLAPAALSLLSTTFSDSRERGTAFAIYGAVASSGLPVGLILGGVLTEYLSWRWVFYVNVPIALVAVLGAVFLLDESRSSERIRFDLPGAVLAAGALVVLVYGFSTAASAGWDAPLTLGLLISGVGILGMFLFTETRVENPLLPLRIIAHRGRGGAYLAFLLVFLEVFGLFLFVSFYLQAIRGYTPAVTGVAFLPLAAGVIGTSTLVSRLTTRVPPRILLGSGLLATAAGLAWLTQLEVGSGYTVYVLPALFAVGLGVGMVAPVAMNLATFGIADREAGVASAALNTSQQVGASLGTALLNTIAATGTATYIASHPPGPGVQLAAQVEGFALATAWGAGILAIGGLVVLFMVNARLDTPTQPALPADEPHARLGALATPGADSAAGHESH